MSVVVVAGIHILGKISAGVAGAVDVVDTVGRGEGGG